MVDFFVIGASKSGSSAVNTYLSRHPEIGMADIKEPHFFDTDLSHNSEMGWKTYYRLFQKGKPKVRVWGETTPTYIRSKEAPRAIKNHNPNAKFILMIRDPVEMAYSLHSQNLYGGTEAVEDFEKAWRLQEKRRQGMEIPKTCRKPESLLYGEYCMIGRQIEHWLNFFPKSQFLFLLQENLKSNPREVYLQILNFIGVQDDGKKNFEIVNTNKTLRSRLLYNFLRMPPKKFPQLWLILRKLPFIRETGKFIIEMNKQKKERLPLEAEFKSELRNYFLEDIARIEKAAGYKLSHWKS